MVGWHHRLNGHESEQAPGDSEGQGSLACCSPWVTKSDMTWQLNNNNAHKIVSESRYQSYYEKPSTKLNAEAAFFGFWFLLIRNVSSSEIHTVVKILSFVFRLCLWCILPYISALVLCSQVQRSLTISGFLSQKVFPHIQVIMEFTSVYVCYLYGLN